MKSNYDLLREEINKRIPDRLTLEFGCEVQDKQYGRGFALTAPNESKLYRVYFPQYENGVERAFSIDPQHQNPDWVPPLGKPLTITDILRVLGEVSSGKEHYSIGMLGGLLRQRSRLQ